MRYKITGQSILGLACAALALGSCTKKPAESTPKPVELGAAKVLGGISLKAPTDWKETPPTSGMRKAQWTVDSGDKQAELVIYYFGEQGAGPVQQNLDRWFGQFSQADGKASKDIAKVETLTVAGLKATRVEVGGRYIAETSPGSNQRHDKPGYYLVGAIVEAPDGPYYLKLIGPEATTKSAAAGFDAMLQSIAVTGDKAGTSAAHPGSDADAEKKKQEQIARNQETRKKDEENAAAELARWTDELRKKAAALVAADYKDTKKALQAILAGPHRVPGNSDRDKYRHPLDTLVFFGIQPTMTVIEAGAGQGWYTEILAPLLAKKGKLIVTTYDPDGPMDSFRTIVGLRLKDLLAKSPEIFGKVEAHYINPPDSMELAPEGTVDMVLAMREMHNWKRNDQLDKWLPAIHKALKPGGVFGVVQHRARPDDKEGETGEIGYLSEDWLIKQIEAAGFKLEGKSEVNANPKDTRDHDGGVWALPPALTHGDKDKDKYLAIGESDRMTLKFVKVQ